MDEKKLNNVSIGQMGVDEDEIFYVGLHPMMPRKYNMYARAKLREFEKRLLTGSKDKNNKTKINVFVEDNKEKIIELFEQISEEEREEFIEKLKSKIPKNQIIER